jgi:hypothetical protein
MNDLPPDALEHGRVLAQIKSWQDFRECFRLRADALQVARTTLDHVGGFPSGHCSALLAPFGKNFGELSLFAMINVLGLRLLVAEDDEALARIRHRLVLRNERSVRAASARNASARMRPCAAVFAGDCEWSKTMNARRCIILTPNRRKAIARKAATIRWRRWRQSEASP